MNRIAKLTAFIVCSGMLAGCATSDKSADAKKPTTKDELAQIDQNPPTDLEGGVRQAQLLRVAGKYDDAIHVLSQLMLVASDDPRVVGEYGKTLAQQGRSAEAVQFLGRAAELSSNDWTVYSALGVAYDQTGNTTAAKSAYDHALALKPDEPIVLNNYALSRLLAGDPETAHALIARAQLAGGDKDPKIASNIAMINALAPAPVAVAAAAKPAAQPSATAIASAATAVADAQIVAARTAQPFVSANPSGSPRELQPNVVAANGAPRVIMQQVPVDPLAGPVHAKMAAKKPSRPAAPTASNEPTDAQKAAAAAAETVIKQASASGETTKKIAKPVAVAKKDAKPTKAQQDAANAAETVVKKMVAADAVKKPVVIDASGKPTKAQEDAAKAAEAVVASATAKKPAAPAKALAQNMPKKAAPGKGGVPSLRLAAD